MTADRRTVARRQMPDAPASAHELTCEIRALDNVEELIASYQLRHQVYGALGYLRRASASGLEIDEYDAFSIPFGAFDPTSGEMIGTLRLITAEPQPHYDYLVHCVLAGFDDAELTLQAMALPSHAFPSVITDEIEQQIAAFNPEGFAVHELSRTIVRPDHRGSGISRQLMELGLAYAARSAPAVLIGSCLPEHVPMYARYGYQRLPRTGLDHFASVGQTAHAVVCRTDVLPEPTGGHVAELLRSMRSGAMAHTLQVARDSHVLYRFATSRRPRRRTMEW
jgi:predicted GNAT family N-acyltransferase